jgi:starch phosphorylase
VVWNPIGLRIYLQIDRRLWEKVNTNPIAFLHQIDQAKLEEAAKDKYFLEEYDRVLAEFDAYMSNKKTWFMQQYPDLKDKQIAYFSFEFGLHESMPFYAGGLGSWQEITQRSQ